MPPSPSSSFSKLPSLLRTLQWVRQDAPIIIHVNLDRALRFLVEDTHYRNIFEIGAGFSARRSWEVIRSHCPTHTCPMLPYVGYQILLVWWSISSSPKDCLTLPCYQSIQSYTGSSEDDFPTAWAPSVRTPNTSGMVEYLQQSQGLSHPSLLSKYPELHWQFRG